MIVPKLTLLTLHRWVESEANVGDIGDVIDMQAFAEPVQSRMEVARSQTQTLTQTLRPQHGR
jgi:hypothetical protein